MNAAVETAIAHLQEAREALNRALDDPTLSAGRFALIRNQHDEIHSVSLTLQFANRKQVV